MQKSEKIVIVAVSVFLLIFTIAPVFESDYPDDVMGANNYYSFIDVMNHKTTDGFVIGKLTDNGYEYQYEPVETLKIEYNNGDVDTFDVESFHDSQFPLDWHKYTSETDPRYEITLANQSKMYIDYWQACPQPRNPYYAENDTVYLHVWDADYFVNGSINYEDWESLGIRDIDSIQDTGHIQIINLNSRS